MYSLLPAFVSSIFLGYGIYAVSAKGWSRITLSLFAVCITSFFWQGTWAILFQIRDPQLATFLIKFGYLLILFLPTSFYHFLVEISGRADERRYIYLSYGIAGILAVFLIGSDLFISGYYQYFWGYYPKAGVLHPIHVLQSAALSIRSIHILYRQQQKAAPNKRARLHLCIGSVVAYSFAAVDYACNYGVEFYPPGVVFIALSLGIITIAVMRYDLLNPLAVAATVAHEMRTPLVSIRMQAKGMDRYLPELIQGYRLAVEHGLCKPSIQPVAMDRLSMLGSSIMQEIDRTNTALDMLLASIKTERIDTRTFARHSIQDSITDALRRYAFHGSERAQVTIAESDDFEFYGADALLTLVLFNLLKNALYAIKAAGKGTIQISTTRSPTVNRLHFTDTGIGISQDTLPHVFDAFFTTKKSSGSGLGLAFCQRVMTSFGGRIRCDSVPGEYTTFTLEFPAISNDSGDTQTLSSASRTKETTTAPPSGTA
jgi:two-component system, CAI-1 autoinducer sensor kinase/phosphatase CqsS